MYVRIARLFGESVALRQIPNRFPEKQSAK